MGDSLFCPVRQKMWIFLTLPNLITARCDQLGMGGLSLQLTLLKNLLNQFFYVSNKVNSCQPAGFNPKYIPALNSLCDASVLAPQCILRPSRRFRVSQWANFWAWHCFQVLSILIFLSTMLPWSIYGNVDIFSFSSLQGSNFF